MEEERKTRGAASVEFRSLLGEAIAEYSGGNVRDFAVDMGWSHTTFYEILNGQRKPSPDLLQTLGERFPKKGAAFYAAAGRPVPATFVNRAATAPLYHFLEPGEVDWLEAEAIRRGVEPGVILREAVREYHDRREE